MDDSLEKKYEGCKLIAYPDPGTGNTPWTIGYGHTKGVKQHDTCTQAQADQWLIEDIQFAVDAVGHLVTAPINDNQQSALVDLVFNIGVGNFAGSTLLKKLNAEDYNGASNEFVKWDMAGGHVMMGLLSRRKDETTMFNTPCTPTPS